MKRRERILRNYEQRCHICGHLIKGKFDLDHVIPQARGGTNRLQNLAPAHASCNRSKQAVAEHEPGALQFSMFGEQRTLKETAIRPSAVADSEGECRQWLMREVRRDRSSSLPTRFHRWLVDRLKQPLTYTQTQTRFLELSTRLGIKAIVVDDTFIFVRKGD